MFNAPNEQFEGLVEKAISNLSEQSKIAIDNLVFVVEDENEPGLRADGEPEGAVYMGIYRGVALDKRSIFSGVGLLPNQIVVYQGPCERASNSAEELEATVNRVVLHEVAHYFGMGHNQIHDCEKVHG